MTLHYILAFFPLVLLIRNSVFSEILAPESTIISGLEFGSVETMIRTADAVTHMEKDLFKAGNILYSDPCSLKTTDGQVNHVIVGGDYQNCAAYGYPGYAEGSLQNARFNQLAGFLQVNASHVLVADSGNHCFRFVNRLSNSTAPFAGKCQYSGFQDGLRNAALFNSPRGVILDQIYQNRVIVTDAVNNAVRTIDLITGQVSTLLKSGSDGPYSAVFDSSHQNVLVTYDSSFGKIGMKNMFFSTVIPCSGSSGSDNSFNRTCLRGSREVIRVNQDLYLVAELSSNLIRIIDMKQSWLRSICVGGSGSLVDGPVNKCKLYNPQSLLMTGNTLYIGELQAIRKIRVKEYLPECDKQYINITIPDGDKEAAVEIRPGLVLRYPPGHYRYDVPHKNCSVSIAVTKAPKCPAPEFLQINQKRGTASFTFNGGSQRQPLQIQLPVGQYTFLDSNYCMLEVTVAGTYLRRRLDLRSNYNIPCTTLENQIAFSILRTVVDHKHDQLEAVCNNACNKSKTEKPSITCENDVTFVSWPTETFFDADVRTVPVELENLVNQITIHGKSSLDLLVYTQVPPIIHPNANRNGMVVSLVLSPQCVGGHSYNELTDTCS